jgi:hypothetical protein
MPRNPRWSRDELIWALDLYLRLGIAGSEHDEVIELSRILNCLAADDRKPDADRYRNPKVWT